MAPLGCAVGVFDKRPKGEPRGSGIERSTVELGAAAVQLFIEALGIEGVCRSGNTGQNRQSDQCGYDGLHDWNSFDWRYGEHHCRRSPAMRTMRRWVIGVVGICQLEMTSEAEPLTIPTRGRLGRSVRVLVGLLNSRRNGAHAI